MGQRSQIFIKITNPAKFFYDKAEVKKAEKLFGKGDTAIMVFHNQWLYGKSSLETALRILDFSSQFTKEEKTNKDTGYNYDTPITPKGFTSRFDTVDKIVSAIEFILDYRPTNNCSRGSAGFDRNCFLNTTDNEIRNDFRLGDNNDGIIIIDTIENKYCFMNINEYGSDDDEKYYSASDLKYLEPVSAIEYVRCYYGETKETCNPYYLQDKTNSKQLSILKGFKKDNAKLADRFLNYPVLTEKEVFEMFPNVAKEIKKEELKS